MAGTNYRQYRRTRRRRHATGIIQAGTGHFKVTHGDDKKRGKDMRPAMHYSLYIVETV